MDALGPLILIMPLPDEESFQAMLGCDDASSTEKESKMQDN